MRPARSPFGSWLLAAALFACGEEPLTQIVVVVDSDWDGFERVELEITGFAHEEEILVEAADLRAGKPLPRRVALVHDGGPLGPIGVTARAYGEDPERPLRVEPRHGVYFERGQTRMLRVDLFFNCIDKCPDQACLRGSRCVDSDADEAIALAPWDGKPGSLQVIYKVEEGDRPGTLAGASAGGGADGGGVKPLADGALPQSGAGGSAGPQGGASGTGEDIDASIDSGPPVATPDYPYTPSNFDPTAPAIAKLERADIVLNCGESEFDSSSLEFTNFCGGAPHAQVIEQSDGSEAALLVMDTLLVDDASSLRLRGARPVIFAVFGDAQVAGTIDASASGATPGPGADRDCATGGGVAGGDDRTGDLAGGGGGGGGFGTSGAPGGTGRDGSGTTTAGGLGGSVNGEGNLSPLRGGCSGGGGGIGPRSGAAGGIAGGGGGALQISAAGGIRLFGKLVAGGGGGQVGVGAQDGGGGGGSGGAILLEGVEFIIDSNAEISANGGGGAAGQPAGFSSADSTPGGDGISGTDPALGGVASGQGGDGGSGATRANTAAHGEDGDAAFGTGAAGGGGGGGLGRVRLNRAQSCAVRGKFSPEPAIHCPGCGGECMPDPGPACEVQDYASSTYHFCADMLSFDDAVASCENKGAHLVTIEGAGENAFLTSSTSDETWIGASDASLEDVWRWVGSLPFWTDGNPVDDQYENWGSGEPNDLPGPGSDCAIIVDSGTWLDRACTDLYPYVCESEP